MDTQKTINAVINTLNQITVSGENNLDKLLGCILALKKLRDEMPRDIPTITIDGIEPVEPEHQV